MKRGLFDRRIPTVFALIVLLIVIGISTFLVKSGIFYIGKAAPDTNPQNFSITNVTDSTFTATFTTQGQVESTVVLINGSTGNTISLDDRDKKTGVKNKYFSHHITVQGLKPKTTYSFKLLVGNDQYENPSYKIQTGDTILKDPPAQNPIFGKVLNPDGTPSSDTIILAKTNSALTVSSYTTSKGEFIIPTNSLRNNNNNDYSILSNDTNLEIIAIKQSMKASVTASFKLSQNLPPITLLQQYVFTSDNKNNVPSSPSEFASNIQERQVSPLSISIPGSGESFTDLRPQFEGTALPDQTVNLSVNNVFSQQVLANNVGFWSYRPDNEFAPGRYILKASSKDESGNLVSVSSDFAIFPQGSQVLADSLNPTTTPTPTPSPTIIPIPTIIPTTQPTATPIPATATATPIPTTEATPTISPDTPTPTLLPTIPTTPTMVPPIQSPGFMENTYILTGLSIILIVAGGIILFVL